MNSKFEKHVDRDEIVRIVSELVRQNTVNPPGNEYLCKEIVTECMRSLGMEISYNEKEPGRTNIVGRIGTGTKSIGFVSHILVGLGRVACLCVKTCKTPTSELFIILELFKIGFVPHFRLSNIRRA